MSKKMAFPMVVAGILIVLTALFLNSGHLKHEREEEVARYTGADDEQYRAVRNEADQYRIQNRNEQIGILTTGIVIVLVSSIWWSSQRTRGPE